MDIITADLSKFGQKELYEASKLLSVYTEGCNFLDSNITLNFNTQSGKVFLCDDNYTVGVLSENKEELVQFFSCPECRNEGTQEEGEQEKLDFEKYNGYCSKTCENKNK